nr:MAG TPA: transposase-like protein [Caudoviricetes sp.]
MSDYIELEALNKLKRDIKNAGTTLSKEEARYLVDLYYQMQEYRKASDNQVRQLQKEDNKEPHETLAFFANNFRTLERNIKSVLQVYAESKPIGQWMLSICGIGPVISAGLMANIDITKVQTAGQIQAFAGLDPTREWNKGEKRPYNARLKTLCWKIGQCFIKVQNNEEDVYGKIFAIRKAYEIERNEKGELADQAKAKLERFNIKKTTDAYKWYSQGKLPPAHINQRASRYAVKIFLSHLFSVWYEMEHKEKPPKPYAIAILNHAHEIPIPNWPNEDLV